MAAASLRSPGERELFILRMGQPMGFGELAGLRVFSGPALGGREKGERMKPDKRMVSWSLRLGSGLTVLALAGGCGTEPLVPATISVSPGLATLLRLDETVQLTATVRDQYGQPISGVEVEWTSGDESVVTVDGTGLVTAVGKGVALVRAAVEGAGEALSAVTVDTERGALLRIYEALDGPNWFYNRNWGTDEPIRSWWGVTTDIHGSVVRLELAGNDLTGTIPAEIGVLGALDYLDLSRNELAGPIPPELGNLTELHALDLHDNELTGPIPPELGSLTELGALGLHDNELSDPIPPELGNLAGLYILNLHNNRLTGPIPPELGDLSSLRFLHLSLSENDLSGPIPPELGNLDNLLSLSLAGNELTGSIPPELGNLTALESLDLVGNELTGSIPPELGHLTALASLDLSGNGLSGPIPPELGNLPWLGTLVLRENELTGSVPPELGNLTELGYLDLGLNPLTGPVPPELARAEKLGHLAIDNAALAGRLPRQFMALRLSWFYWHETDLCSPPDEEFQRWLASVRGRKGSGKCES